MLQISQRLSTIASYIPPDMRVADIGADHGQLLISLAEKKLLTKGIIGELNKGPYLAAKQNVLKAGYKNLIEIRQGDGLTVLKKNEVDAIIIAGVGGALICHILDTGLDISTTNLILQPNNASHLVRLWLEKHGYMLTAEQLVKENGIIYEVIVAERGIDNDLYVADIERELLLEVGPLLWRAKSALLKDKLICELKHYLGILAKIQQHATDKADCMKIKTKIDQYEQLLCKFD